MIRQRLTLSSAEEVLLQLSCLPSRCRAAVTGDYAAAARCLKSKSRVTLHTADTTPLSLSRVVFLLFIILLPTLLPDTFYDVETRNR